MGPNSRADALALLDAAFEAGITHFDVARSYGSGEAEGLLGEFISTRRDQVTVATKFGILPMTGGSSTKMLRKVARQVMKLSPGIRDAIGRQGSRMVARGAFSPEDARSSLETSLIALRTERIDVLLLHGGTLEDCTPELQAYLEQARQEGKIDRIGVGSGAEDAAAIASAKPAFADVLQFEHSALRPNIDRIPAESPATVITFGALSGTGALSHHLREHPEEAARWSEELGVDVTDRSTLAGLMLLYAARAPSRGPVIFSSGRPENIRANAAAVAAGTYSPEQLDRFGELARASGIQPE
jgi:D-threo-aldose 1-dehydrogenase